MSLRVVYTDDFPADVARQALWYARQRDEALALDYARAVEAPLEFLAEHPRAGMLCDYPEPQLADLRFYLIEKPVRPAPHLLPDFRRGIGRLPRDARGTRPATPSDRSDWGGLSRVSIRGLEGLGAGDDLYSRNKASCSSPALCFSMRSSTGQISSLCLSADAARRAPAQVAVARPATPIPPFTYADTEQITDLILEELPALTTPRAVTRLLCGLTSPATTRAKLTKRPEFARHATMPFRTVLAQVEACWADAG